MALEQRNKQINSYPSLGQFAYTDALLGEIDRAIAIASHLTVREAVLDVFSELSLLYLSEGKHHDLIKMLTTSAWTGWQIWVAREIIDSCFDEVFMNQYTTLANPTYPLRLLQDSEDLENPISLLIALGREYFGWEQDDLALHYLEQADEKIGAITDPYQRQRLRGWADFFLTKEPDC